MPKFGVTIYQPLAEYLASQPPEVASVTLTPDELESIIGRPLSPSARRPVFWTNSGNQAHTRVLRRAGWRVARPLGSRYHAGITFERMRKSGC